jgi:hypothetical protein
LSLPSSSCRRCSQAPSSISSPNLSFASSECTASSFTKQLSQALPQATLCFEQRLQTTMPQFRQWWRLLKRENLRSHEASMQHGASASGIHGTREPKAAPACMLINGTIRFVLQLPWPIHVPRIRPPRSSASTPSVHL